MYATHAIASFLLGVGLSFHFEGNKQNMGWAEDSDSATTGPWKQMPLK
jgi:hypothetical protein